MSPPENEKESEMLDAKLSPIGWFLVAAVVAAGCIDPHCPKGYVKKEDRCYRIKDGGVTDAGEDDLDAGEAELDASSSPVTTGDGETDAQDNEPDASGDAMSEPATVAEGSSDPCQGSDGTAVCMGADMYHCSPEGTTESSETCASPQQCRLGIAGDRCAPCLPGIFQCQEARLERCADDGSGWESFSTCDSAALCNETAGACTDKACTPTTRVCTGDTLKGCNENLTALAPIMTCDAGMCDQAQGECDVCVANATACQGDVVVTCDANGRRETRSPCQGATPRCTGSGRCVQCIGNSDCAGEHELCVGNLCEVQPYCGDGRVTSGEACDPAAPNWTAWTCDSSCRVKTAYTPCSRNITDPQGLQQGVECQTGEACYIGICYPRCNVSSDCPSAPSVNGGPTCAPSGLCPLLGCAEPSDCAPGLVCATGVSVIGCFGCTESLPCPSGQTCQLYPGVNYGKCI